MDAEINSQRRPRQQLAANGTDITGGKVVLLLWERPREEGQGALA